MGTDLATKSSVTGSITIRNMDELDRVAVMLATSGYFKDAQDAAQCGVKILAGLEMGFGAFASMAGVHIIQGKPAIGANLMAAKVKASGKYDYRVTRMDDQGVSIDFYQAGDKIGTSTFTDDDAKKAGTQNMGKYPRNMLFARAMSNGVKWFCPDVFLGATVYTPEELGARVDGEGNVINMPAEAAEDPFTRPGEALPAPAPRGEPEAATGILAAQARELGKLVKKHDLSKGDARAVISWVIGRDVDETKDLTAEEASDLLLRDWEEMLAEYAVAAAGGPPSEEEVPA
jgi:hypothetical protein